jgi:tetratricopeptide (TPR) repeat protein
MKERPLLRVVFSAAVLLSGTVWAADGDDDKTIADVGAGQAQLAGAHGLQGAPGAPNQTGQPGGHDRRGPGGDPTARLNAENAWLGASGPTDPGYNNALWMRAHDRGATGDYRGAAEDSARLLKSGVVDARTLTVLAGAAYHLGDYATAAAAAKRALALDPNDTEAMALYHFSKDRVPTMNLGLSLGAFGADPSGAAGSTGAAFQGLAAAAPGDAPMPMPSGMTAEQVAAAARQAAAPGSDAVTRSSQSARDAANAIRIGDFAGAYQLATQAVQLNPGNAQALNFRAIALSRSGRYADAVQDASAALAMAPGSAAALQTRAQAFAKLGKYREALQDAEATLGVDPSNAFAWQNKAFALAGLGDREGTLDALRRSAAADSRFQNQLERALRLPQDADLKLLFSDDAAGAAAAAAAPTPAPGSRRGRYLRLLVLTAVGGLLIALGTLHIVSSTWRDSVRATIRRVIGSPVGASATAGAGAPSVGRGAFWTQYEVIKEIGLGGMGVVYEAKDRSLERRVAVKKMRDEIRFDPGERGRFVNEARLVAQLHHPNIVDIYAIVEDGEDVFLVFEYVEGRTLADAIKSDGAFDFARARAVLKEMSVAVEHAHARGVIHRDLKPSNVMVAGDGRIKVMDFGVARQAKEALTRHSGTHTVAGTPAYMAPEQEQGSARAESDVYALGVCLYEMLTGQLPFGGIGAGMLLNKLNGRLTPPSRRVPSLPAGVDEIVAKVLAPDPANRYRTPAELMDQLDRIGAVRVA